MNVPRGTLITGGPYALVKLPMYTGVALLVLPCIGFVLNTWLGLPSPRPASLGPRAGSRRT